MSRSNRTRFAVAALALIVSTSCRRDAPSVASGLPAPGEPHGDPVTLRHRLEPGSVWRYRAEIHSNVIGTSEFFNVVAFLVTYTLELRVDAVDPDGTADVTLSFRDYRVRSEPRMDPSELPELEGARVRWRLAPDGSVLATTLPDPASMTRLSAAQLAAMLGDLATRLRLPRAAVRLDDPWRFDERRDLALPHSADLLHVNARHEAWIAALDPERATIRMTSRLDEPEETVPASALLPGLQGEARLTGEGAQASDVELDRARGVVSRIRHRSSFKTTARVGAAPIEAIIDASMSLTLLPS